MSESKKEKEFKDVEKRADKFGLFTKQEDFLPIGIPLLDSYIAGYEEVQYNYDNNLGFCRGKCYSFAGKNGIGKTTFILDIISRWIKKGFSGIYQDVETGLNENLLKNFGLYEHVATTAKEFLDGSKSFFVCSPTSFNESLSVLVSMLKVRKFDFCIVDTFKQLLPDGDVDMYVMDEKQKDNDGLMPSARAESDYFPGLRRITRKFNIVTIGAQQIRIKKAQGFKIIFYEDEAGGNAFLHNMDARFMFKDKGAIEKIITNNIGERESKRIGTHLELISKKNRFGMRFLHFTVIFGKGISMVYLYKDVLIASKNIIEKERGVHIFNIPGIFGPEHPDFDEKLDGVKISGKDSTLMAIKEKFDDIEKFIIDNKLMYIEKE
jgi:RecA/RadA recombinase